MSRREPPQATLASKSFTSESQCTLRLDLSDGQEVAEDDTLSWTRTPALDSLAATFASTAPAVAGAASCALLSLAASAAASVAASASSRVMHSSHAGFHFEMADFRVAGRSLHTTHTSFYKGSTDRGLNLLIFMMMTTI